MGFIQLSGLLLLGLLLAFTLLWLVSLRASDASLVDRFWGPAFVAVAATCLAIGSGDPARRGLLFGLVAVWGIRLGLHIHLRNRGQGEDSRYVAMRTKYGARFRWLSMFIVFWLQASLAWAISMPLQVAGAIEAELGPLDLIGAAMAVSGIAVESIADLQLVRFKRDPASRGQVLDRGLWRYSRHPNYFGDALTWWGFGLIGAGASPFPAIVGPALMTYLLLKVSGVSLLESTVVERRPAYRRYIETTSAFIPWPPKK